MYAKLHPLPLALAVAERALFSFSNQWLAGLQPQLILETSPDGQICVSSRVVAGDVPTHAKLVLRRQAEEAEDRVNPHYQAGEAGHRRRPHRHGPSRQRRRLRREAARAAAAAGTADQAAEKTEPAVKPADKNVVPPTAEEAAQSPTRPSQVAAEAIHPVLQPSHHHDQNLRSVTDELCPDRVYTAAEKAANPPQFVSDLQPHIPQLDGHENVDREWWCYCCRYAKLFQTEEILHQHHDTTPDHMLTYEECNICYPWHVWT